MSSVSRLVNGARRNFSATTTVEKTQRDDLELERKGPALLPQRDPKSAERHEINSDNV
jgi:hypothetical protein